MEYMHKMSLRRWEFHKGGLPPPPPDNCDQRARRGYLIDKEQAIYCVCVCTCVRGTAIYILSIIPLVGSIRPQYIGSAHIHIQESHAIRCIFVGGS